MPHGKKTLRSKIWARRRIWVSAVCLVALIAAAAIAFALYRAEPILRSTVIQTLSARFKSKVELEAFHVSFFKGFQVSGEGLRIFGDADPNNHEPGVQPILEVAQFRFSMRVAEFLRSPMRVDTVYLRGMKLNLPPREQRADMRTMQTQSGKIRVIVDNFICDDAHLIINTLRPGKLPIEFDIASLKMTRTGEGKPLRFEAKLTNPKPVGQIFSSGDFGPWQPDNPRETPLRGNYSFTRADLSTIKGLGGILSSTGKYSGVLEEITVEGMTDTPDFRLAMCKRRVPLHTEFHAVVDGTSGDTFLQPVRARILTSWVVARGSVVKQKNPEGHRVKLDVTIENGKIDDLLKLAVQSDPMMTGFVHLKTSFDLQPGTDDVANRLKLAGDFTVSDADFTDDTIQNKINTLSLRSRGKAKLAKAATPESSLSDLDGSFSLAEGNMAFSQLHFEVPGTVVSLSGNYNMDGSQFDFRGTARMDAKLSHMVTGWKALLLKPVDPFFSKNGAGTELPIKITGNKAEPHFALDFHRKPDSKNREADSQAANSDDKTKATEALNKPR
jgi:hypothetical protein